ncbi:MAG: DUF721 domain-containing protein [Candidatus Omnitrophica bacterium]|nr:DUF721 domain-containing protein [Candidatus Omnitrophota bacterium]
MESTKPLSQAIQHIFRELSAPPKQKNARLTDIWPKIVGDRISAITTPCFQGRGVVVWVKNSPFAFELSQRYGALILKRLQNEFGEQEIEKIWFRVGGSN